MFGLKRRCAINWANAGCPHDDLGRGRGRGKRFNFEEVKRWVQDTGRRLSRGGGPDTLVAADELGVFDTPAAPTPSSPGKPADSGAHDPAEPFDFALHKQQLSLAKLRKELAMAQKYELAVEVQRGTLMPMEEVERSRLDRVAYARALLIGGPSTLAPDLAHAPLQEVEARLSKWVSAVLDDLAGGASGL